MMMLKWFNASEAADVGAALADEFAAATAPQTAPVRGSEGKRKERATTLEELHERADREVRPLELNFYQKARVRQRLQVEADREWHRVGRGRWCDSVADSAPLARHRPALRRTAAGRPRRAPGPKTPARPTLCLRVPRRPSRRAIMPRPWSFLMSLCRLFRVKRTL